VPAWCLAASARFEDENVIATGFYLLDRPLDLRCLLKASSAILLATSFLTLDRAAIDFAMQTLIRRSILRFPDSGSPFLIKTAIKSALT